MSNGELDFAVVLSGSYSPDLLEQRLYQEQVYLCVPESLLRQYYSPDEVRGIKLRSLQGASVRDFARLPFALMDNRLGQRMREYFTREQVHPAVPFTGTATRHILPLCAQGMAACYCTQVGIVANASVLGDQLNIFPSHGPGGAHCPDPVPPAAQAALSYPLRQVFYGASFPGHRGDGAGPGQPRRPRTLCLNLSRQPRGGMMFKRM